jgi:type IV secretory pathway TrbF-like protein
MKMSKVTGAGVGLALVFVILKCLYYVSGLHYTNYNLVILTNIVCVLLAVGLAMYMARDKNGKLLALGLDRIKAGMRGGAVYAIIVSTFVYFYYNNIDKKFFKDKIKARVELATKADFPTLQKNNPDKLANKTHADFIDDEREQAELWFSPFMVCTLTLVALMVCSMVYSLVLNVIFKNLFFKTGFK